MENWSKNRRFWTLTAAILATFAVIGSGQGISSAVAQAPRFQMNIGGTSPSLLSAPDPEVCRQVLATIPSNEQPDYQPGISASGGSVPGADLPSGSLFGGGLTGGLNPTTQIYIDPRTQGLRPRGPFGQETTVGTVEIAPDGTALLDGRPLTNAYDPMIERCRAAGYR